MKTIQTSVLILGAGSGGFGCAYALSARGVKTVVADRNPSFGGTPVFAGVTCFEPGVSYDGVHRLIAARLLAACGGEVQRTYPAAALFQSPQEREPGVRYDAAKPWMISAACGDGYDSTLARCKAYRAGPDDYRRFMTDEDALNRVMTDLIEESGGCTTLFGHAFVSCKTDGRRVVSVTVTDGAAETEIFADTFVDASGSIVLCRSAGCEVAVGDEKRGTAAVNGATLVFRLRKGAEDAVSPPDDLPDVSDWEREVMPRVWSCFNLYPNGDVNVNMLPTLTGAELFSLGEDAYRTAYARVLRYVGYLRREKGLAGFGIVKVFPMLGVREDYRLVGRKVLSYGDIRKGLEGGADYAAIADHALDTHGIAGSPPSELDKPYGVPLDCLRPKEYDNLFVACRGASFDHTAASSARLTRTVLSMGENLGKRIAEAVKSGKDL